MMKNERYFVFFDLEGPLSPQDNAFEVMGLLPGGHQIFEVISRYDDLLALEGRIDYEPGDTLKLIVPFLISHGITEKQIQYVSAKAGVVSGAKDLVSELLRDKWEVYIVSTSYEQHASNIALQIGVPQDHVLCTAFPIDRLRQEVKPNEAKFLREAEEHIVTELFSENLSEGVKDKALKPYLDEFYWQNLPITNIGRSIDSITVVGGRRKLWAIERICFRRSQRLEDTAFVGDSITDYQAAKAIESFGGLALAFNGNAFVIPYATVGVASTSLWHIKSILESWQKGGRSGVWQYVKQAKERVLEARYDWLVGSDEQALRDVLRSHKEIRTQVRQRAARLG